jgi:hypothetical protein
MDVPLWVWALPIAAIVGLLVFDLFGHVRAPHTPTLRESAVWSAGYVGIAVVFGLLFAVDSIPAIVGLTHDELPFVNGGEHVTGVPEVPTWLSLTVILVTLLVTAVASLPRGRSGHGADAGSFSVTADDRDAAAPGADGRTDAALAAGATGPALSLPTR